MLCLHVTLQLRQKMEHITNNKEDYLSIAALYSTEMCKCVQAGHHLHFIETVLRGYIFCTLFQDHPSNAIQAHTRAAQYQFFLINSISIILFPFLSISISISINSKRAYQYQYIINYWKILLSISISISINILPYQYRYQYFSTCLKSSYYKSPAVQIVRQRSGPQSRGQAGSRLLQQWGRCFLSQTQIEDLEQSLKK